MPAGISTLPINTAPYVALNYQRTGDSRYVEGEPDAKKLPHRAFRASAFIGMGVLPIAPATPFPGTPGRDKKSARRTVFDPAYAYELVFTAKDPLVLGIGFRRDAEI